MFGNFIYFIVALLIYTTYQPPERPDTPFFQALLMLLAVSFAFAALSRLLFNKLEKAYDRGEVQRVEDSYNGLLARLSILAIGIFAVVIYVVNLGAYMQSIRMFRMFPTLEAIFFLGLFLIYLSIVWASAYDLYEKLNRSGESRRKYVTSHISFSIPVLLPWFFLSAIADFIIALPFETPKNFLMSTTGQTTYFLVVLFVIAIIGPWLIQRFWGCRPLEPGYARFRIEHMCKKARIRYRDIMMWPLFGGKMITAGVMGLVSRFRYILVTPGLLQYLNPVELDAVIAHEIGHVKKKHLVFYLFFFVGYLVIAFSTLDLILWMILYIHTAFGWFGDAPGEGSTGIPILFSFAMILIFLLYFRYIFGYFMRNFERQADIYVYQLMDSAQPLITTFKKIAAAGGQSPDQPNWHHFSINERINYLKKCERSRKWIDHHNRKIRASILIYFFVMILIGWGGYALHAGGAGQMISANLFERLIHQQLEKDPENPELHLALADMYQGAGDLEKSVEFYKKTLSLAPDNATALNNLAWLYATSRDTRFFRPEKALALSLRAAELSREAHILDTLAQSHYANGHYHKAIETEKQALALATEDRAYYRRQLKKFEETAAGGR